MKTNARSSAKQRRSGAGDRRRHTSNSGGRSASQPTLWNSEIDCPVQGTKCPYTTNDCRKYHSPQSTPTA